MTAEPAVKHFVMPGRYAYSEVQGHNNEARRATLNFQCSKKIYFILVIID